MGSVVRSMTIGLSLAFAALPCGLAGETKKPTAAAQKTERLRKKLDTLAALRDKEYVRETAALVAQDKSAVSSLKVIAKDDASGLRKLLARILMARIEQPKQFAEAHATVMGYDFSRPPKPPEGKTAKTWDTLLDPTPKSTPVNKGAKLNVPLPPVLPEDASSVSTVKELSGEFPVLAMAQIALSTSKCSAKTQKPDGIDTDRLSFLVAQLSAQARDNGLTALLQLKLSEPGLPGPVYAYCLGYLTRHRDESSVPHILALVGRLRKQEPSGVRRWNAFHALGKIGGSKALEHLAKLSTSDEETDRELSVYALEIHGTKQALAHLKTMAKSDKNNFIRKAAKLSAQTLEQKLIGKSEGGASSDDKPHPERPSS